MYSFQGQFTVLVSNQGLSPYVWQSITNGMGLVSALILACLSVHPPCCSPWEPISVTYPNRYGNVGIKVLYANVGIGLLKFPELTSSRGKLIFAVIVPIYWLLA